MLGFLVVLGLILLFVGGMAIKLFVLDEAMNAGCGSDPIIVDGEEVECVGCPEEKKKECALRKEEEAKAAMDESSASQSLDEDEDEDTSSHIDSHK